MEVEEIGPLTISTPAQEERLQSGVEPALLFVEQAVEEEDGGFGFLFGDLPPGRIPHGREGFQGATRQELPALEGGVDRQVEVAAGDELAGNSALLSQLMQGVLHIDVQDPSQFGSEVPAGGAMDESFGRGQQGAETGEPNVALRPQAVVVETGDLPQGIESAAMRVAGQVIEGFEFPEDGEVDGGAEGLLEFIEGGDFVT